MLERVAIHMNLLTAIFVLRDLQRTIVMYLAANATN